MLVCEPEVILMDEPFSALDEYLREQMQDELSNMLAMLDKPAILVSHSSKEVENLCDKNTIFKEVIWKKPHYYEILHNIFKKVRKLQMKKKFLAVLLAGAMVLGVTACGSSKDSSKSTTEAVKKEETTTITLAAAASLEKCYTEKLIPMFEKENKGIKVEGSYDSSGKLQSQIENGMEADVFMSAATEQMNNLVKGKYISKGVVVELLENKVVLIAPKR